MSKKETWIVAVSGGADSMALLNMYKDKYDCIAAHVDYQKREDSHLDRKLVEAYCRKEDILCEVKVYHGKDKGNFQAQARTFRYDFFYELVEKHHASGVLLAHHQDDALETYLMNKERLSAANRIMEEERILNGVLIKRPLLHMRKAELYAYCAEHKLPYREDSSNHEESYTRNRMRQWIQGLDPLTYDLLYKEMKDALRKQKEEEKLYFELSKTWHHYMSLGDYNQAIQDYGLDYLRHWLAYHEIPVYQMSDKQLRDMHEKIQKAKLYQKFGDLYLSSSYGELWVGKQDGFTYSYNKLEYSRTDHFILSPAGSVIEGVNLSEEDFPLLIRNYHEGDKIAMRFGTKKVNRFFIDRKIPYHYRKLWVIIENSQKDVIFVEQLGCDVHHYANNPNLYVLKW